MSASVTAEASWVARTSPVMSWVSVTSPRRRAARYSFSPLSAKETAFVAWPTKTGSTPVAMGSRVPAWPTRFSRRMPRILAQTSMLVHPAGLSTMRMPSGMASLLSLTLQNPPRWPRWRRDTGA